MKPKVFIGSSTKALPVAEAIQFGLKHDAEAIVWNQYVFRQTQVPIETLTRCLEEFDFAVFVFLPEDAVNRGDEATMVVRDNVLFELGLFLGRLGRERNFLVAPQKEYAALRLPSDLSGITPAFYDSQKANRAAAVSESLYEFKQTIRDLGPRAQRPTTEAILYDGRAEQLREYDFAGWNGCFWQRDKQISPRSEGELRVLGEGVLRIDRRTPEGRYEVTLRHQGQRKPSISRKQDMPERILRLTCEARVEDGDHTLNFVLKDEHTEKWAANERRKISSSEWTSVKAYFRVSPTADLLLRIDDERPSSAPTSLYLRNFLLVEEQTAATPRD